MRTVKKQNKVVEAMGNIKGISVEKGQTKQSCQSAKIIGFLQSFCG